MTVLVCFWDGDGVHWFMEGRSLGTGFLPKTHHGRGKGESAFSPPLLGMYWLIRGLTRPFTAMLLLCVQFMAFTFKEGTICIQFEAYPLRVSPNVLSKASQGCSCSQAVCWSGDLLVLLSGSPHLVWKRITKSMRFKTKYRLPHRSPTERFAILGHQECTVQYMLLKYFRRARFHRAGAGEDRLGSTGKI